MKKLSIISNQIKNNTYSYTGKGAFEAIVNNNKDQIVTWLEDLVPLQKQIELLKDMENIEFQKRNYTRILTKIFPDEYKEFVSLNILVRDANIIAQYYNEEYNVTLLYDNLINNKFLKYPGKYDKYVDFELFQKFIMMYREDLIQSLNSENQSIDSHKNKKPIIEDETTEKIKPVEEELVLTEENEEPNVSEKDTNWTQLLLGKLK
ncbi:MAG: hypothetical protein U9R37_06930 [Campylobacterota bacterium]|nr:hypothetical protein [Campylobacterota bacterium]